MTAAPSSASSGQPPGACETRGPDGAKPVPAGLDAAGQPTGTLTLIASGARDDQNDGGADLASSTVTAGYIDDDGRYQELTRAECEALLSLEANGRPVTVDIGSLGSYRVLAAKDAETGDIVITGLSMKVDNALVRTQLLIEGAIAVAGTLILVYNWTQSQYYVAISDGKVAIYQGIPQTLGPISLSHVVETYDEPALDELDERMRKRLEETVPRISLNDARTYIEDTVSGQASTPEATATPTPQTPQPQSTNPQPSPAPRPSASRLPEDA